MSEAAPRFVSQLLRLMDQVQEVLRFDHYALSTENPVSAGFSVYSL